MREHTRIENDLRNYIKKVEVKIIMRLLTGFMLHVR